MNDDNNNNGGRYIVVKDEVGQEQSGIRWAYPELGVFPDVNSGIKDYGLQAAQHHRHSVCITLNSAHSRTSIIVGRITDYGGASVRNIELDGMLITIIMGKNDIVKNEGG